MDTERYTQAVPMEEIQVKDGFWGHFIEVARTKIIPYQWEALNDRVEGAAPSYCMRNFRVAAGLEEGGFGGRRDRSDRKRAAAGRISGYVLYYQWAGSALDQSAG